MAVAFAIGAFCVPTDSSATQQSISRQARHAEHPELAPLRSRHQELVKALVGAGVDDRSAVQAQLKSVRAQMRAILAAGKAGQDDGTKSPASLRDQWKALRGQATLSGKAHGELVEAMMSRRAKRMEMLRARHGDGVPSRAAGITATHVVTNCDDDGAGSLRDAITNAVTGDEIDLTQLSCSTITLTSGGIWAPQDGLTLTGPGAGSLTIDAGGNGTVIDFGGYSGELEISGLTLANGLGDDWAGGAIWAYAGDVTLRNSVISGASVLGTYYNVGGAAVVAYAGDITLVDSTVTGNSADAYLLTATGALTALVGSVSLTNSVVSDNYIYADHAQAAVTAGAGGVVVNGSVVSDNTSEIYYVAYGGGIFSEGDITITGSTVSGNVASSANIAAGGGVFGFGGQVSLVDSRVTGNHSSLGGGVFIYSGVGRFTGSTISGNEGQLGGGICARVSEVNLLDSTVSGNSAGYMGGGLFVEYANANVGNATISGNSSVLKGGAISIGGDSSDLAQLVLSNSTITGNSADGGAGGIHAYDAEITLNSTIAFGNIETAGATGYGADIANESGSSVLVAASAANLVGDSNMALPADTLSSDPLLGPLADNGGATLTHALAAGSPAIDAGNNLLGFTTDQRGTGFDRVMGAAVDIGAFEVQAAMPPALAEMRLVPATSSWALGVLGAVLGFFGWRRGWFAHSTRRQG